MVGILIVPEASILVIRKSVTRFNFNRDNKKIIRGVSTPKRETQFYLQINLGFLGMGKIFQCINNLEV